MSNAKGSRPFHLHVCRQCEQEYACEGEYVLLCPFYLFSDWNLCPACAA